ncbi:MAG: SDR family NAD(P)-dependent oxidoreductase [Clostridia bacterium]|jgi:3alpha(or 20beta)-hydroxysteroid dehydrogenase|nr:SDR family NAD(P)-dependent oxidoreductase [Clostridia bacterium]
MKFKNKIVLITGGARGMGKTHAEAFVKEGATVFITDVLTAEGEEIASSLKNCSFIKQDVSKEADWINVIKKIDEKYGKLDILVNNAGIVLFKPLGMMTFDEYMRVVNVNQVSVFLGMTHSLNLLKKGTDASVINISSVAGLKGMPAGAAYNSSKFAVRALTEVAALDWAPYKIRVNTICPGAVDTAMLGSDDIKDLFKEYVNSIPMKRIGQPEELTKAVMFLASSDSSYCTGSTIVVDGGSSLI